MLTLPESKVLDEHPELQLQLSRAIQATEEETTELESVEKGKKRAVQTKHKLEAAKRVKGHMKQKELSGVGEGAKDDDDEEEETPGKSTPMSLAEEEEEVEEDAHVRKVCPQCPNGGVVKSKQIHCDHCRHALRQLNLDPEDTKLCKEDIVKAKILQATNMTAEEEQELN